MSDPRQRLLDAAVAHLAEHGAEMSLRGLAAALGTSHRMLLYHFGSKEKLLVEVASIIQARNRTVAGDILLAPGADPGAAMRRLYRYFAQPAHRPYLRLYFELYARGLRGDPVAEPLVAGSIEPWLAPVTEFIAARGVPRAAARADARISLAITYGLALDLLATGDTDAVDAAAERFISGLEERWAATEPRRGSARGARR
jgi:AcrR family transcriptional regulator